MIVIFLSDTTTQWIGRYMQSRQDHFKPLFIRHSRNIDTWKSGEKMRLTVRSVQRIVIKYAKRCGLSIKATPQTLRHCVATYLMEEFANPVPLQTLLEHECLDGITRYIHASNKYTKETHHKYHPTG